MSWQNVYRNGIVSHVRDSAVKGLLMKVLPAFVRHFEQMLRESSEEGAWRELGGVGHLPVLAGCHSTTLQPPPGGSSLKRPTEGGTKVMQMPVESLICYTVD